MSKHFTLEELLYSKRALDKKIQNLPSFEIVDNLKRLAETVLDPLREEWGSAISVTSGFRSEKLNKELKGSPTSQHRFGMAADLSCKNNKALFNKAKEMIESGQLEVGQLIDEYDYSWVHISLPDEKHHNQILHLK